MCHATIPYAAPRYDLTQYKARHNVGPWDYANPRANLRWPKRLLAPFYSGAQTRLIIRRPAVFKVRARSEILIIGNN